MHPHPPDYIGFIFFLNSWTAAQLDLSDVQVVPVAAGAAAAAQKRLRERKVRFAQGPFIMQEDRRAIKSASFRANKPADRIVPPTAVVLFNPGGLVLVAAHANAAWLRSQPRPVTLLGDA